MATHAAEAHQGEHHGPPPAHQSSRMGAPLLGMYLFLASEAMLFGSFFAAYFFVRVINNAATWPPTGYHRPVFAAAINTVILVTSSFTMHWATTAIKKGNRRGLQAGLVLTLLMGAAFFGGQIVEFARVGFAPRDNAFATTFFGLTGLHGFHVFVGLTLLLVATVRAFRGHYSAEHHHGVELSGIYWHFVDVMWILVFLTVYIL